MNLAIAILVLLAQEKLTFKLPANTPDPVVKETAKAIKARISEYGYREIWVREETGQIALESKIPFTEAMKPKLEEFSLRKANSVEIRFVYPMTTAEFEQFKPGEQAPRGSSWYKWPGGWLILRDSPVLQVSGKLTWHPAKQSAGINVGPFNENIAHLAWNEAVTKQLLEYKDQIPKCRLFVDGDFVDARINITWTQPTMKWTMGNPEGWEILGVCINHPLPVQLTK